MNIKDHAVEQSLSEDKNQQSVVGGQHASLDDDRAGVEPPSVVLPTPLSNEPAQPASSSPADFVLPPSFQTLDPRWIIVDRIAGWIVFGVVAGCTALGLTVFIVAGWPPGLLVGAIVLATLFALGLLAWSCHRLPAASYRHAGWQLDEKGLEIRRGIMWRHEITIPLARVQHTDVHQGPLLRQYGLAKLIIHTAGTENASIELEGLALETAHRLRDALVAQCEARHVN